MDMKKLLETLQQDMKHWSADALKEALDYADDKCLTMNTNDVWWWKLRRSIGAELKSREERHEH